MQRAPDEVFRSRTRPEKELLQQHPGKQPLNQPQTERLGSIHYRLGPRDSVYSRLRAWTSVHSRLGPQTSIHSRLGSHFDSQHEQPSRRSFHLWLSPQGASSTSHRSRQSLNPTQVQPAACEELVRLLGTHHMHYIRDIDEPNT
ncbi:hypothetical protein COP1_013633 [Malus domestica]